MEGSAKQNRRSVERVDVSWDVDCEAEDTFLYASISNISELGIFVRTTEPLDMGTCVKLRFSPRSEDAPFVLEGVVQWVNPLRALSYNRNPGMGVIFVNLTTEERGRLVELVRTMAYVRNN